MVSTGRQVHPFITIKGLFSKFRFENLNFFYKEKT
jgi:hypothetical protein